MPIKKDTKKEFKRIMDGMLYHCMDLAKFMAENVDDPWFETEQGKRMRKCAVDIMGNHSMICMEFMLKDFNKSGDNEGINNDIEKMLKDMLE